MIASCTPEDLVGEGSPSDLIEQIDSPVKRALGAMPKGQKSGPHLTEQSRVND